MRLSGAVISDVSVQSAGEPEPEEAEIRYGGPAEIPDAERRLIELAVDEPRDDEARDDDDDLAERRHGDVPAELLAAREVFLLGCHDYAYPNRL